MSNNNAQPATKNPAKTIALTVVAALLFLGVFYTASDIYAPSSSRGFVSAHVVQIAPRVSGEVTEVFVQDDSVVNAGDPLFSLDARPFELSLAQAKAQLASTVQNIDASGASLLAAQAAVAQARSNLDTTRLETNRIIRLEKRGLVSTSQADAARGKLSDSQARLKTAQANLQSARKQLGPKGQNNPAILAAQAQLERAQYDLNSTIVHAPHYGVVTNVTLAKGQYIAAGNPALTFIDADAAWITVDLRENQLQNLKPGDKAHILFDAVPGKLFEGHVQSIAWGIAPGRNAKGGLVVNEANNRWFEPARRIPVRIELNSPASDWPRQVRVGGKVHVVAITGSQFNPIALLVRGMQRVRSWASYLY